MGMFLVGIDCPPSDWKRAGSGIAPVHSKATVPLGRGGTAEEVAQAIVWLLSDAASYTTMSLMEVSGGR